MKSQLQNGKENILKKSGIDDVLAEGKQVATYSPEQSEHIVAQLAQKHNLTTPETTSDEWPNSPEEVPTSSDLPDLTPDLIPEIIRPYVVGNAENLQVSLLFIATGLIASFAGIIGSGLRLCPKKFDKSWRECINILHLLIGPPSVKKSPSLEAGLKPLRVVESFESTIYQEKMIEWKPIESKLKAQRDGILDAIKTKTKGGKAADAIRKTIEELELELQDLEEELSKAPIRIVMHTNDPTQEATLKLQAVTQTGISIVRDEFAGFTSKLEGHKDNGDRQYYMEGGTGGKEYRSDRATTIAPETKSNTISIQGTTQPGPWGDVIAKMKRNRSAEDGFVPRFQLATIFYGNKNSKLVDKRIDPFSVEMIEKVSLDLHREIRKIASEEPHCKNLNLTDEAQNEFTNIYEKIQNFAFENEDKKYFQSHILKSPKTLCVLATIFEVLESAREGKELPPKEVGRKSLLQAWEWLQILYVHADHMYSLDKIAGLDEAAALIQRIKAREVVHGMKIRDIKRKNWSYLREYEDITTALKGAEELGWCKSSKEKKSRGASYTVIYLHPQLRE